VRFEYVDNSPGGLQLTYFWPVRVVPKAHYMIVGLDYIEDVIYLHCLEDYA
jgi:hypothetical protein